MRKLLTLLVFGLISVGLSFGQTIELDYHNTNPGQSIRTANGSEMAPNIRHTSRNFSRAMWDLEFNYSAGDSAGSSGQAGVVYTPGGEFWTARWSDDTLFRYNAAGQFLGAFTISNGATTLDSIRAMTTDGTNIYAVTNRRYIYEVDPVSRTVSGSVRVSANDDLRYVTYDATANGGAGGFWGGNFSTNIYLIARNGSTLRTITSATHGQTGIYGAAVDNSSTGGPYLWMFTQSGGITSGNITQLDLTTGTETGILREVTQDLGAEADALSGGLFISDQVVPGKTIICGVLQDAPSLLFGYDLDFTPVGVDAAIYPAYFTPTYTQIPESLVPFTDFSGILRVQGNQDINGLSAVFDVSDTNGAPIYSDQQNFPTAPSATTGRISFNTFVPPATGAYDVSIELFTTNQTDEDMTNNRLDLPRLVVSDSVLSYDDQTPNAVGYTISGANGTATAVGITRYNLPADAFVKGIQVEFVGPQSGLVTYPVFITFDQQTGEPIGGVIARGPDVTLDANQTTYFMKFDQAQRVLQGQFWGFGLIEPTGSSILIAQSPGNYQAGTNFFARNVANPQWLQSSVPTNRFIRPVVSTCNNFKISVATTPDTSAAGGTATVTVNDPAGRTFVAWSDPSFGNGLTATGISAGTYSVIVADELGCSDTVDFTILPTVGIERELLSNMEVFPVPANDVLNITGSQFEAKALEFTVLSVEGKVHATHREPASRNMNVRIPTQQLSPGVYILRIIDEEGNTNHRSISVMR